MTKLMSAPAFTSFKSRCADAPFDKPTADIIFRSSDHVNFNLHKVLLGLASPVFEGMVSLPQPNCNIAETKSNVEAIELSETSEVLDTLLRLVYPVPDPRPDGLTIPHIADVLAAAKKYALEESTDILRNWLKQRTSVQSLAVYSVACKIREDEHICHAARSMFKPTKAPGKAGSASRPMPSLEIQWPEMRFMTASEYHCLLTFHVEAKKGGLDTKLLFPPSAVSSEQHHVGEAAPPIYFRVGNSNDSPADLILRSSDGVNFHVLYVMLNFASSLAISAWPRVEPDAWCPPLRTIHLSTPARILEPVSRLCYPVELPSLPSHFDDLVAMLDASTTYRISRGQSVIKARLMQLVEEAPTRLFFLAILYGWEDEAQTAASHAVYSPIDEHLAEMERISADTYFNFLRYRRLCRDAVRRHVCAFLRSESPATVDFFSLEGSLKEVWWKVFTAIRPTLSIPSGGDILPTILAPWWTWPEQKAASNSLDTSPASQIHSVQEYIDACKVLENSIREDVAKIKLELPFPSKKEVS